MKSAKTLTVILVLGSIVVPALIGANPKKAPADAPATAPATAPEIPEVLAVVEGAPIKKGEVEERLNMMLAAQGMSAKDVPAEEKIQAFHEILDNLIVEKLLDKRSADEKVTDEEIQATLGRIAKRYDSLEAMKKEVEAHGQTMDQVKKDIILSLRQSHWMEGQIKGQAEVSDAEVEDFYKKNPDRFNHPEEVRASHILVATAEDAKPEVVAEKQKQAQAIADRLKKSGEDFNKLAEQLSEDPNAKEDKGDLGFFAKDQMVPEFSSAAFAMKKGDVSDPVRSKYGFHIIKVTDHKAAGSVSFEEAKPGLTAMLKRQKENDAMNTVVQTLRKSADVKVNLPALPSAASAADANAAAPAPAPAPGASAAPATPAAPAPPAPPAAKPGKSAK